MKQMQLPESMMVTINYEDKNLPANVREFKPAVYWMAIRIVSCWAKIPSQGFLVAAKQDNRRCRIGINILISACKHTRLVMNWFNILRIPGTHPKKIVGRVQMI
jgi:hypothetical protein